MLKKVSTLLLFFPFLMFFAVPSFGAVKKHTIGLKLGLAYPSNSDFEKDLEDTDETVSSSGAVGGYQVSQTMTGGILYYRHFYEKSGLGVYLGSYKFSDDTYYEIYSTGEKYVSSNMEIFMLGVSAYRLLKSWESMNLFANLSVELYLGSFDYEEIKTGNTSDNGTYEGTGVGLLLALEGEYFVSDSLALEFSLGYRIGSVSDLKKGDTTWGDDIVLNGFDITLGLSYGF
jgi:hypothetical protein